MTSRALSRSADIRRSLRIDADGSRLYASNYRGTVSVIDIADYCVDVIPGACCVQQVDTVDGALIYAAGNDAMAAVAMAGSR